ncbi:MAG: VCBS repeat-containing protein [Bacteroidota bacterium]
MMRAFQVIGIFTLITLLSCTQQNDTLFQTVSPRKTGVVFKNILKETEAFNVMNYGYFYNGGGVAVGDVNNDGLPDIYFTGNLVASDLYLNQGDLKFQEIAKEAGVEAAGLWNTGVTMADVNGDGWLDIYVCRSAAADANKRRNLLFINEGVDESGIPKFSEQAALYGVADPGYSTQAAFFDYDRDGDLDLYVLNHSVPEFGGFSRTLARYKKQTNPAFGDKLYENLGPLQEYGKAGGFTDVTRYSGILTNVLGFGLGIGISDVNLDGWPDIYISNDYNEQDYLYINQKNKSFKESLSEHINHTSLFSMGNDIADINNDALPDILTLDMLPEGNYRQKLSVGSDNYEKHQLLYKQGFYHQYMRNMLHLNLGNGGFSEIGQVAGISKTNWSWAALFADYDNDGWKDLFITNGYKADYTNMDFLAYSANAQIQSQQSNQEVAISDLLKEVPAIEVPNYIYQNQGSLHFENKGEEWGMDQILLSNGAAYADLDQDGDLDLITNNVNSTASIFRNQSESFVDHSYLTIDLKGRGLNTDGIGTRVVLHMGERKMMQELMPTRGFQSSVEPILHFGLGQDTVVDKIEIFWPDSSYQVLNQISANQQLKIIQENNSPNPEPSANTPFLRKAQDLAFTHKENDFIDFKREPLLPKMLSTQGPRLAIGDVNLDGLQDIYVGGANSQPGALLLQGPTGDFAVRSVPAFLSDSALEDIGAAFFDADGDQDLDLYVVSGGAVGKTEDSDFQDRLYLQLDNGKWIKSEGLPPVLASGSCVKPYDIDGDEDMDLFVGGRLKPGNYPQSPRSYLLENDGSGHFSDVTTSWSEDFSRQGMVCDAQWVDVNGDQRRDLITVGEWRGPQVWINKGNSFENRSAQWVADSLGGWWNVLHPADLDGDGDTDLVLGNEGLNTLFRVSAAQPSTLYFSDFDGNGQIDPIMNYFQGEESYPMAFRDDLLGQLVPLKKQYTSYASYASATMENMFPKEILEKAYTLKVTQQKSGWLEFTQNGYIWHEFPVEAQFAPIYGIETADVNADGNIDLLLGGNFSAARVQFGRSDANWGLVLLGNGAGDFQAVPQWESGLKIQGDLRDMKLLPVGDRLLLIGVINNGPLQSYWLN